MIFQPTVIAATFAIIGKYAVYLHTGSSINAAPAVIGFIEVPHSIINRLWPAAVACIILQARGEPINHKWLNSRTALQRAVSYLIFLYFSPVFFYHKRLL